MAPLRFFGVALGTAVAVFAAGAFVHNEYLYLAAYTVAQYIVLATAWNILGGYTGYVNFGAAGFFATGAYTSVFLHKTVALPLFLMIPIAGLICAVLGLAMGYLTLRLRGVFFAIATLAMAIVLHTLVVNWSFVGGARGAYIIRPREVMLFAGYSQYLFATMLALAAIAVSVARWVEHSRLGRGLAAIRDDETAAECSGVPTLRLKLVATSLSGLLMGFAGAPFPYYVGYVDPAGAFNLAYGVNSIAMPLIGGMSSWVGPLIGAVLLGTLQQVLTVTISSAVNLLLVGVLLVTFVTVAPNGIVGLFDKLRRKRGGRDG
ncbi:MAG: branched-chain amino acid ABC transporter permease [Alphaproteobacteria bacterium]|nr:branched-chain amino acid ABC transporter permease [Alphaproteobacteria bacterium]